MFYCVVKLIPVYIWVCGYVHVYDFLIQQMTYSEENVPDGIITEEGQEGSVPVISSVQTIDATSTGKLSIHVHCTMLFRKFSMSAVRNWVILSFLQYKPFHKPLFQMLTLHIWMRKLHQLLIFCNRFLECHNR